MQKHCICIKMGFIQLAHEDFKDIGSAHHMHYLDTKEDGYVEVTMFPETGGEGSKMDYRKRGEVQTSIGVSYQRLTRHK